MIEHKFFIKFETLWYSIMRKMSAIKQILVFFQRLTKHRKGHKLPPNTNNATAWNRFKMEIGRIIGFDRKKNDVGGIEYLNPSKRKTIYLVKCWLSLSFSSSFLAKMWKLVQGSNTTSWTINILWQSVFNCLMTLFHLRATVPKQQWRQISSSPRWNLIVVSRRTYITG